MSSRRTIKSIKAVLESPRPKEQASPIVKRRGSVPLKKMNMNKTRASPTKSIDSYFNPVPKENKFEYLESQTCVSNIACVVCSKDPCKGSFGFNKLFLQLKPFDYFCAMINYLENGQCAKCYIKQDREIMSQAIKQFRTMIRQQAKEQARIKKIERRQNMVRLGNKLYTFNPYNS